MSNTITPLTPPTPAPPSADNPAILYLNNLQGKTGRTSMISFLNRIAKILGGEEYTLDNYPWASLQAKDLNTVKSTLVDQDFSPRTINNYLAAMRGVARQAWLEKQMHHETYLLITQVKRATGNRVIKGRALTVREIERLYDVFDDSSLLALRDHAIITILLECGIRRKEVQMMTIGQINFKECSFVARTKGNKERHVYLTQNAARVLEKWLRVHPFPLNPDNPVFVRFRRSDKAVNAFLSSKAINDILHRWRKAAGLEEFTPHDLRRTFATFLFDNHVDSKLIKDAMGHENIATTMRYDKRKEARTASLMRTFSYGVEKEKYHNFHEKDD